MAHSPSAINNINQETHTEADSHSEIAHEHTLFAESIYSLGNFQITNSMLNSWLVVVLIIVISLLIRGKIKKIPRGIQNVFEMIIEGFLGVFDSVTGSPATWA